jgi:predicted permease
VQVNSQFAPGIDLNVLAFGGALSMVTALLFGLLPALRLSRASVTTQLKDGGHANPRWALRTGTALVVVQTALALTLMAAAGLLIRSLQRVLAIDPGFPPERVLVLEATPVMLGDGQQRRALAFYDDLINRVRGLPGVDAAGAIDTLPFWSNASWVVDIDGPEIRTTSLATRSITPGYFAAMGIPLRAGRDFTDLDREGTPCVAIVNELAARRYWPDRSPLGQRLRRLDQPWCEIVGLIGDIHHQSLEDSATEELYFAALQFGASLDSPRALTVVARTLRPSALVGPARALTTRLTEPALVGQVGSLADGVDRLVFTRRSRAVWLSALGVLAVLLAAIGMYGLTSYAVARKTQEIGIRMALGATDRRVLRTVIGTFTPAIAYGVILGLLGAWAVTRVLTGFLYGVTPTDPVTFGSVSLLLTAVVLVACYLPARRATTIDPVVALRCE